MDFQCNVFDSRPQHKVPQTPYGLASRNSLAVEMTSRPLPTDVLRTQPAQAPRAKYSASTETSGTPRVPTPATLSSQNANPEWWTAPISVQQSRVLREATGLVLRDAIRFYESGKTAREDIPSLRRDLATAREAIDALQKDGSGKEELLGNILFDFDKRYNLQQALLADLQRNVTTATVQSDILSEKHATIERELASLSELKSENMRLHALIGSLAAEVGFLLKDYASFRERFEAMESARADDRLADELQQTETVNKTSLPLQSTDSIMNELGYSDSATPSTTGVIEEPITYPPTPPNLAIVGHSGGGYGIATTDQGKQVTGLLKDAEREYLQNRPRSESSFIWMFLERVDDEQLCWHIQVNLASLVDEKLVKRVRPRRMNGKRRVVSISPKFTWHQFTHAVRKMSMTPWAP